MAFGGLCTVEFRNTPVPCSAHGDAISARMVTFQRSCAGKNGIAEIAEEAVQRRAPKDPLDSIRYSAVGERKVRHLCHTHHIVALTVERSSLAASWNLAEAPRRRSRVLQVLLKPCTIFQYTSVCSPGVSAAQPESTLHSCRTMQLFWSGERFGLLAAILTAISLAYEIAAGERPRVLDR